jgi:tRNA A37 methylthiotransferase MiaB
MCFAGFSGETEEEHAATLDLLRNTCYDNAFLFSYSERAKTYASRHLPDDVPDDVKRRRLAEAFEAYRWVLKQITLYCTLYCASVVVLDAVQCMQECVYMARRLNSLP